MEYTLVFSQIDKYKKVPFKKKRFLRTNPTRHTPHYYTLYNYLGAIIYHTYYYRCILWGVIIQ